MPLSLIKSQGLPALSRKPSLGTSRPFYTIDSAFPPTQGTDVITLLNTVHNDPSQFLTPREFNPEHFLDANQSFKKSPAFMPFSAGECGGDTESVPVFRLHSPVLIPLAKPSQSFKPPHPQL